VPILLLLLLAVLQFALIFGAQIGLTNAAREAARLASVVRTDTQVLADAQGPQVKTRLTSTLLPANVQSYDAANLDSSNTRVCYSKFTDVAGNIGVLVRVDVVYRHPLFIPLIASLIGDGTSLPVTASQQFPVENPPIVSTDIPNAGTCY